ncbi:MAG: pitrilysin family protein [Anaerolineaceae bacterium]|nr:pitrilysin family protein [Anaerolineaceae bacterium]
MSEELRQYKLNNGLQVNLKEIHSAPIISHWVWYRVGSRNEVAGLTGISHWVEHMQFKGTHKFPNGVLDRAISRDGGMWNAFTYLDWTTFFETMPADKISLALELESDRMVNSIYDPEEVNSERTVVISEREGNENDPLFKLDEQMQEAAFKQHPYRNEVIGSIADLRAIQRDDLYNHYRSHYCPSNAILAMAGDFDSDEMIKDIEKLYGGIPGGEVRTHQPQREAPLAKEERIEVKGPGETTYLILSYRAPAGNEDDFFAVSVLDSLITGPSSLNMFGGGGISNKTSRLYQELVEKEYAVSVYGGLQATIDPHLYSINLTVRPEKKPDQVLKQTDKQIERIQQDLVSQEEINRAVKQARALFAYGSENITNQGFWLGYAEMFADYSWFTHYVDRMNSVTPQMVRDAAQRYLARSRRVVGVYLPQEVNA